MKRLSCALACGCVLALLPMAGGHAQETESKRGLRWVARKVSLYLPNRVIDALDVVGVNISFGVGIQGNVHLTRFAQLGHAQGQVHRVGTLGRQVGVVEEQRRELLVGCWGNEQLKHQAVWGSWEDVDMTIRGMVWNVSPEDRAQWQRKRDITGVGIIAHVLLIGGQLEFRPREACDFILSCIGIDFMDDDME